MIIGNSRILNKTKTTLKFNETNKEKDNEIKTK